MFFMCVRIGAFEKKCSQAEEWFTVHTSGPKPTTEGRKVMQAPYNDGKSQHFEGGLCAEKP